MTMELRISQILAGDVLLCFSGMTAGEAQAAGTGYSHTAIALTEERALEASTAGVHIVPIERILDEYDHIAVLRNSELWDQPRLQKLKDFAAQVVNKKFNFLGLKKFPERKEKYQDDIMKRIEGFFEGTEPEIKTERGVYFCSELITAAFINVEIIEQSAAVVFTPETFSPSDIGKDKAFGFFCGYVKSHVGYNVPDNDYFQNSI